MEAFFTIFPYFVIGFIGLVFATILFLLVTGRGKPLRHRSGGRDWSSDGSNWAHGGSSGGCDTSSDSGGGDCGGGGGD